MKKILFVCTGNSCRSVMAEGLLKDYLSKKGRTDVHVLSAGVSAFGGAGPTPETVEVMRAEHIDVSNHISQPVTPQLVKNADIVFCMEQFQRDILLTQIPESAGKVHLLKTFLNKQRLADPNIADPIGRPKEVYESCLMTIKEAVDRVGRWIVGESGTPQRGDEKWETEG
ncbi:MAG: low molecular weight protein arginine phosphatase [Candidatus Omnitrophica bacterium]|nr:low molecular weight protein arginine phosphatase [Candidatus Omnitrophota bacterium]